MRDPPFSGVMWMPIVYAPIRLCAARWRWGSFGTERRKSASRPARVPASLEDTRILGRRLSSRLAQLLPILLTSINVFRVAFVSVVLTLAIGQTGGLLCEVWCHDATSTGCPHHESTMSPSVRADDTCANVAAGAVAFVREDSRRSVPAPDAQNVLAALRYRLVAPPSNARPVYESGRRLLLEERPLVIVLRI
jgi:hypothetical protein